MLTPSPTSATPPTDRNATAGTITMDAEMLALNLAGRSGAQLEMLEWFRHHCVTRGLTWEAAGKRLHKTNGSPYSRDSIYQAMSGARGLEVSLEPLCASIERYRRDVEAPLPVDGFLPTRMAKEIDTYLRRCQRQGKVGFIVGENAVGKTTAINHLERTDHRITKIRIPEGGHLSAVLPEMARRRGLGDRQTIRDLSRRMIAEFTIGDLLILDEGDECFRARNTLLGTKTLSFFRRLYDESGCALAFVMDPAGYKRLQSVESADPLRRLYSRRLAPLFLPKFYREDLDMFARQQGLEPAPNRDQVVVFGDEKQLRHTDNPQRVQDAICSSHKDGLFVWLGLLKEGKSMAEEAGKEVTWGWVLKAHALFLAMETQQP